MLKDHLEQLVKSGHLKEFVVDQEGVSAGQGSRNRSNNTLPPPLGIIEVIHATFMGISVSRQKGVLSVVTPPEANATNRPEKRLRRTSIPIIFYEASMMASQIGGFLVKKVMVDHGSGAKSCTPIYIKG